MIQSLRGHKLNSHIMAVISELADPLFVGVLSSFIVAVIMNRIRGNSMELHTDRTRVHHLRDICIRELELTKPIDDRYIVVSRR